MKVAAQHPSEAKHREQQPPTDQQADYPIELCKAPAEIAVIQQMGITHWWLRTPDFEAGMGRRGGGVPGVADQDEPYTWHTTINDHKGRGNTPLAECHPVSQTGWGDFRWERIDRKCLQIEMALGRDTGLWTPPLNDCHEAIKAALEACRIDGELPAGGIPEAPHDMGADETVFQK